MIFEKMKKVIANRLVTLILKLDAILLTFLKTITWMDIHLKLLTVAVVTVTEN